MKCDNYVVILLLLSTSLCHSLQRSELYSAFWKCYYWFERLLYPRKFESGRHRGTEFHRGVSSVSPCSTNQIVKEEHHLESKCGKKVIHQICGKKNPPKREDFNFLKVLVWELAFGTTWCRPSFAALVRRSPSASSFTLSFFLAFANLGFMLRMPTLEFRHCCCFVKQAKCYATQ